jgi:hypothetical protein
MYANFTRPRGFIALMSVIILSMVLLLVVVDASLTSFNSRFNALDAELKGRSEAAADACANQALLQLANDLSYAGNEALTLNTVDSCRIGAVATAGAGSQKTFKIQATSSSAVTNLFIVVLSSDLSTVSWQEMPTY